MSMKTKIIELRLSGKTYEQIAYSMKCAKSTVSYHCSKLENNEHIVEKNNELNRPYKKLSEEIDENTVEMITVLHGLDINLPEISDITGVSTRVLQTLCRNWKTNHYSTIRSYEAVKFRRKKIKILSVLYKGGKCCECGFDGIESLCFHHLDPSKKDFTISMKTCWSWKRIKTELDKCQLLCMNCHQKKHNSDFVDISNKFRLLREKSKNMLP